MFDSERTVGTGPRLSDLELDMCFAVESLDPIENRYHALEIDKQEVEKLQEKLSNAFPNIFSNTLKQKGFYFPLPVVQTNEQIRKLIVGDSTTRLIDEIRLVKAIGLKDKDRVLDLAAGFGRISILMAEQADINVLSVDIDKEKTKLLQNVLQKYRFNDNKLGSEKITPITGDITNLEKTITPLDKVDVVIIKDVLGLLSQSNPNLELTERSTAMALAEELKIFMSGIKTILKDGGKVVVWDGDLRTDYLLRTLETGMYLDGFKEREKASLIKFQIGDPPQNAHASFGIFFYNPNDRSLVTLRNIYKNWPRLK